MTMITPSYLGETIEYSSLHACRSTLEDPTVQVVALAQQLVNGLTLGSVYVLIALSVTIVFGLTGIVNFAVGEMMMIAAYLTIVSVAFGVPYWLALIIVVLIMLAAGLALEVGAFRWTLPNPVNGFIVSLGMILILQASAVEIWGAQFRTMATPFDRTIHFGGVVVLGQDLFVAAIAIAAMVLLVLWLYRSKDGRALRAASEDRETARLMGIPATRLTAIAFAVGVGLAGLAGALVSSVAVVEPFMSANYLLKGFIVATVGGLGNINGAFVTGILVALIESVSAQYLPIEWTNAYVFAAMVLILLFRPGGLFGIRRGT